LQFRQAQTQSDSNFEVELPAGAAGDLDVVMRRLEGDVVSVTCRWQPPRISTLLTVMAPGHEMVDGDYTVTVRRRRAGGRDAAAHAFRMSRE
jgi:hypothetical protein